MGQPAKDDHAPFGILVISHGELAVELIAAMEHLMGPQAHIAALSIRADEPLNTTRERLRALAARTATKGGLVLLTDLFGGTPANLAHELLKDGLASHVITGASLPMLVRLVEARAGMGAPEAVQEAAHAGRHFIRVSEAPASLTALKRGTG